MLACGSRPVGAEGRIGYEGCVSHESLVAVLKQYHGTDFVLSFGGDCRGMETDKSPWVRPFIWHDRLVLPSLSLHGLPMGAVQALCLVIRMILLYLPRPRPRRR